jgi:hypothetical protein
MAQKARREKTLETTDHKMTPEQEIAELKNQLAAVVAFNGLLLEDFVIATKKIQKLADEKMTSPMPKKHFLPGREERLIAALRKAGGTYRASPPSP